MPAQPSAPACARAVVLTRPAGQNGGLARALEARGWRALDLPALRLTPEAGPVPDPADFDLVVFVSGNAVRMFLDTWREAAGRGRAWPDATAAAVVGPASARALREHPAFGQAPRLVQPAPDSPHFDSEALWAVLSAAPLPSRVLIVRGGRGEQGTGRDWLAGRLREAGATVTLHRAYRRVPAAWTPHQAEGLRQLARAGTPTAWLLTSAEGVDAVRGHLAALGLLDWWADCRLVATHPRIARHLITVIAEALPARGDPPMLQTCAPRDEDILAAIESVS
ncbi:uroporphyrinogen-III synthase [Pigmentiphaga sp. GD03639]|uniref:Uroporphyrinogen-III synthase n=2 Tax=Pigmentiphaga TaxID=152267 RepID=A0ABN1BEZ0_9BURK|nr:MULTISPECIES: uroporphyrinogen-III synthase [unclassified Pigmentiphaga]MDH2238254.1 uroporphyrinogen-III synthase [Pigmentiphaga sp. GD03639]